MGGLASHHTVTLAASDDALRRWAFEAQPGARLLYASGTEPPRDQPVWLAVRALVDLGLIRTFSPRRADGQGFNFVVERIQGPIAIHDTTSREARVFAEIERCLAIGEPMPTDAQFARRCGFANADAASFAVRKLKDVKAGDRRIAVINWGPNEHRQAMILSTGQITIRRKL